MAGLIGIDPGFSGGIVALDHNARIRLYTKMPVIRKPVSRRWRTTLDLTTLCVFLKDMNARGMRDILIENVHASPQMGVSSSFNFGRGFGSIEGVMAAQGFEVHYSEPSVWKPKMGLGADKKRSLEKFTELFDFEVKHDGLAEAALLAWYGINTLKLGNEEDPLC